MTIINNHRSITVEVLQGLEGQGNRFIERKNRKVYWIERIAIHHKYMVPMALFQRQPDSAARSKRCLLNSEVIRKRPLTAMDKINHLLPQIPHREHHMLHRIVREPLQQILQKRNRAVAAGCVCPTGGIGLFFSPRWDRPPGGPFGQIRYRGTGYRCQTFGNLMDDGAEPRTQAAGKDYNFHATAPFSVNWNGTTLPGRAWRASITSTRRVGLTMNIMKPPPPAPETFPEMAPALMATSKAS